MERFARSGLTREAFCKREGISPTSFWKWKAALTAKTQGAKSPVGFVEISQEPGPADVVEPLSRGEVELALPGGVRLRWRI